MKEFGIHNNKGCRECHSVWLKCLSTTLQYFAPVRSNDCCPYIDGSHLADYTVICFLPNSSLEYQHCLVTLKADAIFMCSTALCLMLALAHTHAHNSNFNMLLLR